MPPKKETPTSKIMPKVKSATLIIVLLIGVLIVFQLIQPVFRNVSKSLPGGLGAMTSMSSNGRSAAYDGEYAMDSDMAMEESFVMQEGGNIAPSPDTPPAGDDAEDYEVKSYNASIETTDKGSVCADFFGLKSADYIIFESANEYERGCSYTLKVKNENAQEVLTLIESYDPENFNESVYTIKRNLENILSEEEILKRKAQTIEETLTDATEAFDSIADFATQNQDAGSLAQVVTSKIELIERLTNERIENSARLDRIARNKAEQLDRLAYTNFYISVYESKYLDAEQLADDWKDAVQEFFYETNKLLQGITIGVVALLLAVIQFGIYYFILFFVVRFAWKVSKKWWTKK